MHGVRARGFCVPTFEFSTVRSGTTSFIPTEFVAYFADKTVQVVFDDTTGRSAVEVIHNKTGRPLLVPIIVGAELRRYARVPAGSENCAFCEFLASRGFVYRSGESAGVSRKYHPHCDCQIVPVWGKKTPKIAGYDPDALYAQYEVARDAVVARKQGKHGYSPSLAEVASSWREMYNRGRGESVHMPKVLRDYSSGWPEYLELLRPAQWQHILVRHGEGGNAPTTFGTLDPEDIAILLLGVVQTPISEWEPGKFPGTYVITKEIPRVGKILVAVNKEDDKLKVKSIYPFR